ncbi:hypothetical protein ACQPYA_28930 [Micromonospora sp. CA-263727]|uniref:hypothetical protein n=1 Tax=Micromonospora sp. CA-263727 TaxID=3239967 RepID=UPI003D8EADE0
MDVDPAYRLRGALLAAVGVAALVVGGWWWQGAAPAAGGSPVERAGDRIAPDGAALATTWLLDAATGAAVQVDPGTGDRFRTEPGTDIVFRLDGDTEGGAIEPGYGYPGARRGGGRDVVWTERATLRAGESAVRQAVIDRDVPHLLRFSCTGPGELLVVVAGGRAADPMTAGCDGTVTMTEISGTGGPVRVSFSPAGAEPIHLEAGLLDLP